MISLLLFILSLCLNKLVVKVGTVALELTGLPEEQANFQAISAFTTAGFTTKESEIITSHPSRRRIIRVLLLMGSAGVITTVGTLSGVFVSSPEILNSLFSPEYLSWIPINPALFLLLVIILVLMGINLMMSVPGMARLVKEIISAVLLQGRLVIPTAYEEIAVNSDDYAVVRLEVTENNPLAGRVVEDTGLAAKEIVVLSQERIGETLSYPPPSTQIRVGDMLVLFGPSHWIRRMAYPPLIETSQTTNVTTGDEALEVGSVAPDFTLRDQHGKKFALSDFRGNGSVILIFYPKDRSYFCSTQLRAFSEVLTDLTKLNVHVAGINPSSQFSHKEFCDTLHSDLPILSDFNKKVCRAYRCLMLGGLLVNRTVYVIDRQGRVAYAQRGRPTLQDVVQIAQVAATA